MLLLARLILVAQSAAHTTNDHCSCHSVKSKTFTRLMYERGFRAAAAHRASDLKFSPPPRRDLANWLKTTLGAYSQHLGLGLILDDASTASKFFRAHLPCDRMIEVMREGHPRARPMDADDPEHPCRKGGPRTNESWWLAENEAAVEQLWQAETGEAPLGGTARKHLGLPN